MADHLSTPSPLSKDSWRRMRSELFALRELLQQKEHQRITENGVSSAVPLEPCSICHNNMLPRQRALFTTSCGHTFHFACIKRLTVEFAGENVSRRCPLCRADFAGQTPPRTPVSERALGLPGFVTASSLVHGTPASPVASSLSPP